MVVFQPTKLTPVQAQTLAIIRLIIDECGVPPTVRDIQTARGLDYVGSWVHLTLKALERKGFIIREKNKARAIKLVLS